MDCDLGAAWMRHMRQGEWDLAWRVSDEVLRRRNGVQDWRQPRHLQAIWNGAPLEGRRVLLRCYHGLGDTIQFIRFAPSLRARTAELTIWAQPALIPLLRTMPGIGRLLPLHDGTPEVAYDVDAEIMELAHILRLTPAMLPGPIPYLLPAHVAPRPDRRQLAVGLVWRAGDWEADRRSIPFSALPPLFDIPGVSIHILQRGEALRECPPDLGIMAGHDDIHQAAAVMCTLDLVISVDSMPAHLAGALGRPVWTLLAHQADWRWMEGREDTPWYPTMRLFRQPQPGDWSAVIARVAAELRRLAAQRSAAA